MGKRILTEHEVFSLVSENKYAVTDENRYLSRCIDGRYKTEKDLPPLAFPGGDAGELALIFATANSYGLEIDRDKVLKALLELIGGPSRFHMHSDHHADPHKAASGCGHIRLARMHAKTYDLNENDIEFIDNALGDLKKRGAHETILEGDHAEGAVIQVSGNYSIFPRFRLEDTDAEVFVFHATLAAARHRKLAELLIEGKAIKLFPGGDAEYLADAFFEVTENHLFETSKQLAQGLPLYAVEFKVEGEFTLRPMGNIGEELV